MNLSISSKEMPVTKFTCLLIILSVAIIRTASMKLPSVSLTCRHAHRLARSPRQLSASSTLSSILSNRHYARPGWFCLLEGQVSSILYFARRQRARGKRGHGSLGGSCPYPRHRWSHGANAGDGKRGPAQFRARQKRRLPGQRK